MHAHTQVCCNLSLLRGPWRSVRGVRSCVMQKMAEASSSPQPSPSPASPAQRPPPPPTDEPPPTWSFPPPRPLSERVLDYGIISGMCGGTYGAMSAARHGSSVLLGTLWIGGHWVFASSCFLGVRTLLIQDNWANDREGVSGIAAAITGGCFAGLHAGRRAVPRACAGCFVGGFAMHYAHRWCVCPADRAVHSHPLAQPSKHCALVCRFLRLRLSRSYNVREGEGHHGL